MRQYHDLMRFDQADGFPREFSGRRLSQQFIRIF
jgi:hypothetical protein